MALQGTMQLLLFTTSNDEELTRWECRTIMEIMHVHSLAADVQTTRTA